MKILLAEDDYLQANWIKQVLEKRFPGVQVTQISTEHEFRTIQEDFKRSPPDLVLLDVMLRWTDPGPDMVPAPEDVKQEGYYRAGLRCERLLRQAKETAKIPVIFHTVLEHTDLEDQLSGLPSNTFYVGKDSDPSSLIDNINDAINTRA